MHLVEFITDDGDTHRVVYWSYPTDEEIEAYILSNDWLAEEDEAGELTWVIEPITYVQNERE